MNAVRLRHALRFAFHQHRTSGRRDDRPPSFSDLLQGRDLADIATVVLGNNRNLMLAPGGLLEHLPAGEPSYCLGPGPLYLPLGHRTRPELPPSARHALFGQDERHAVVLLPDHAYVFYLTTRRPAWSLWIGELPELDVHLPAATIQALRDLSLPDTTQELRPADTSQQQRVSDSISNIWARLRSLRRPGEPWADAALPAELAGDLQGAAKIHRANGSMLRAAHLFERAAREAPVQR